LSVTDKPLIGLKFRRLIAQLHREKGRTICPRKFIANHADTSIDYET